VRRERLQPTRIYVSGYVSSTLFVVDGATGSVMGAAAVGSSPWGVAITAALGRHLPFWDRHLHLVVLTHPDQDHLAGLVTVLERYDVDLVLAPALTDGSPAVRAWQEAIAERDIPQREAFAGQWIDLGGGARLSVVYPPREPLATAEVDDDSLVLKVSLGEAAFLLTGDIGAEGEASLMSNHTDLRAPVLKVAHHGSAGSTSAVISVGEDKRLRPSGCRDAGQAGQTARLPHRPPRRRGDEHGRGEAVGQEGEGRGVGAVEADAPNLASRRCSTKSRDFAIRSSGRVARCG
jgi:YVTN family beta-propeller protein